MDIIDKEKQTFFEETRVMVEEYVDDRVLLFKLQASEKVARLVSRMYILFILGILLFVVLLIITVIVGYFLAFLTDNFIIGFGIVGIMYLALILVLYQMHKRFLGKRVMNAVVKTLFETNHEDNAP